MSAPAALPVINIGIDYEDEKKKITNFLEYAKGVVPPLRRVGNSTSLLDVSIEDVDTVGDDDEQLSPQQMADEMDDMRIGAGPRTRGDATALKYKEQLQRIANRQQQSLVIDLKDLIEHRNTSDRQTSPSLVHHIMRNAAHYIDIISECVDDVLSRTPPTIDISHKDDVLDVIMHQRMERNLRASQGQSMGPETAAQMDADGDEAQQEGQDEKPFPPILMRRYTLYLKPYTARPSPPMAVRAIKAAHLGSLLTLRGIVTRVSEVKPFLLVDAYACDSCGAEIFQEVRGRQYMPLSVCTSQRCKTNRVKGKLHQQARASKFAPFQEVKVQEMADQVPVGHIPRTMTIHLAGPLTRSVSPGDVCDISGIFLPTPYSGFKAIRAGLLTDTYLSAQHVSQLKKSYDTLKGEVTPEMEAAVEELKTDPALYEKLSSSVAPEIYGHEDVKKCLLLLLVGGCNKTVGDGMKIRGDINVCLMGDPGVAKSQLLKYITKIAPRGIYTTGRGSSGVGLTAAVMRDPVTDEMVLEGGALVLADNGIACIDEFDKMDESDRTAIHEVMEQQTISISKAGISTTLNARTSILAAANPLYGRYNPRISPVDNINLPAALLSRFDILFLILDTPSRDDDERLAQHVTYVHMNNAHPPLEYEPVEANIVRHYIAAARQVRPVVPKAVSEYVVSAYVKLRKQGQEDEARDQAYTYTSARTLLGVLRMSQALARLRFSKQVDVDDVDEALRLMDVSKASLYADGRKRMGDDAIGDQSYMSKIFRIIRDMGYAEAQRQRDEEEDAQRRTSRRNGAGRLGRGPEGQRGGNAMDLDEDDEEDAERQAGALAAMDEDAGAPGDLLMREVRDRVFASGWVEDQLQECIQEYSDLGVIQVAGNRLVFL